MTRMIIPTIVPFALVGLAVISAVPSSGMVRIATGGKTGRGAASKAMATMTTSATRGQLARVFAQRITDLAVLIAGRKRSSLREEWRAHLVGDEGNELSSWEKLRAAVGFAVAAVRYRLRDASVLTWKVTDAVLKSRPLSNMFVLIPTASAAVVMLHRDGTVGMLGSAESIAAIGSTLYGLVRVGRWWRDVKPPEPKARRTKE